MSNKKVNKRYRIGRRQFLKGAAVGLAGAAVGPFFGSRNIFATNGKGKVVMATGSGTYQKAQIDAYYKPFTKETGIEVEVHSVLSLAQKKAMAETGQGNIDMVGHPVTDAVIMARNGWLEPIDYGYFRKEDLDNISIEDRAKYQMIFIYWAEVMAYRTDIFPKENHPKNWAEFWDTKKFPGPRCMGDPGYIYGFEFALLADGVPMNKLYPLDIDRGLRSMSKIRKDVVAWWGKSAALPAQLMNDKEVYLCSVANGRILEIINAGAPVAIEWNEGCLIPTCYSVVKGAKNKENAMKLLAYIARPEPQAEMARLMLYGPSNKKAFEFIDPKIAKDLPTNYRDKMFVKNDEWWQAEASPGKSNREVILEKWEGWKIGG